MGKTLDHTTANFEVYEDGVNFYGTAKVTLPDISFKTATIAGAGIGGDIETVIMGMVNAMSMKLEFRTMTPEVSKLNELRRHTIDLRVAQQQDNLQAGGIGMRKTKYVVVIVPKQLSLGTLAPASTQDVSTDYSVFYIAGYQDGVKFLEIDPINNICYINGTDYSAEMRSALGG